MDMRVIDVAGMRRARGGCLGGAQWLVLAFALALSLFVPDVALAAKPTVSVTRVTLGTAVIKKGTTYSLGVSATKGAKLTYKTSNEKVVKCVSGGKVKGLKAGTATITITAKKGGSKTTKKVKVKVVAATKYKAVKSISAKAKATSLKVGATTTVSVTFNPKAASNKNLIYKSSNAKVLTVSAKGKVKAVGAGTAKVIVTSAANAKAKKSITFKVTPVVYTVSFDAGGGSAVAAQKVNKGSRATRPADPVREEYEFDGWYQDPGYVTYYDFGAAVTGNLKLYAKWRKITASFFELGSNKTVVTTGLENGDDEDAANDRMLVFASTDLQVDCLDVYDADTDVYVTTLYDSGDYDGVWSFDDMSGDGIYTGVIDTSDEFEGTRSLIARYGDYASDVIEVGFYRALDDDLLGTMGSVDEGIGDLSATEAFVNGDTDERRQQAEELLNGFEADGSIVEGSIAYDEQDKVLGFEYGDGVLGGISLEDFEGSEFNEGSVPEFVVSDAAASDEEGTTQPDVSDDDSGIQNEDEAEAVTALEQEDAEVSEEASDAEDELAPAIDPEEQRRLIEERAAAEGPEEPTLSVQSIADDGTLGNILILNSFPAFETDQASIDDRTDFYVDTKSQWEDKGFSVELKDSDVTVDDYKRLDDFDVVTFSSHGGTYSWKEDGSVHQAPVILLHQSATWDNDKRYSAELKSRQLVRVSGRYRIMPGFFESQYAKDQLSDTFVFSECCQFVGKEGTYDYAMLDALQSRGAKGVVGFHNSVYAVYSRELMKTYIDYLIDGRTSKKSFDDAKSMWGSDHKVWYENKHGSGSYPSGTPIAVPNLRGADDARLIGGGIANGGFEEAVASGSTMLVKSWSKVGDVRSVTMLGDVHTQTSSSKRMAIITTGIGSSGTAAIDDGTEGSVLYQSFVVPSGATKISFAYDFVSEEPMEYVGSKYNDAFHVQVVHNGSTVQSKLLESINTSSWKAIGNINFAGGDETVYHTGWKTTSVSVSGYAGTLVTLRFVIFDVGDSIYDSAAVIDNVTVS